MKTLAKDFLKVLANWHTRLGVSKLQGRYLLQQCQIAIYRTIESAIRNRRARPIIKKERRVDIHSAYLVSATQRY